MSRKTTQIADIQGEVKMIIYDKLRTDEMEITPELSFKDDFGADSLDIVELVMEFEKHFDITIPDDDAQKIHTVGDAIEYIEKKKR